MKYPISVELAGRILITAMVLLALFHLLVIVGVVPQDIVWGGRANGAPADLVIMESIAVAVTIVFGLVIALKLHQMKTGKSNTIVNFCVWVICAYFVLNIIGNLASDSAVEKAIFTPVSIIIALLTLRLALDDGRRRQ